MGNISYIQARRLILSGCSPYLANMDHVIAETPIVEFVMIVCEFPNIFPIDFSRLPLEHEVDFAIEVEPSITPIFIPLSGWLMQSLRSSVHSFRVCYTRGSYDQVFLLSELLSYL